MCACFFVYSAQRVNNFLVARFWHRLAWLYEYNHFTLGNYGIGEKQNGNEGLIYGCIIKHRKETG